VARFCRANGYTDYAEIGDGVYVFVCKMLFNWRAVVGTTSFCDDAYCYDTKEQVIASLNAWDVLVSREPLGWKKHPQSGRYRPGGNPALEIVQ
jgi:hypothetical protein